MTDDGTVVVTTPGNRELAVHNVHLVASPYGPYTAAKELKKGAALSDVVVKVTEEAVGIREKEIAGWSAALATQTAQGRACLLAGDFNEPSHLSWDGADDGKLKVDWPCSKATEGAGLLDCFTSSICSRPARSRSTHGHGTRSSTWGSRKRSARLTRVRNGWGSRSTIALTTATSPRRNKQQ